VVHVKNCQAVTATKPTVADCASEIAVVPFSLPKTLVPTGNGQNLIPFNQSIHQPADNKCDENILAPLTKPVDTTVAVHVKNSGVQV
jgi:hypothetical protein